MITDQDKEVFFSAIYNNDVAKIVSTVTEHPELLKARRFVNRESYTPLQMAFKPKTKEALKALLKLGAEITPDDLIEACSEDMEEFLDILLEYKPDVNVKNCAGFFPLDQAAITRRSPGITEKLLKHGAQVDMVNGFGMTALHRAVENCNFGVIPILLRANADITIKNKHGLTALETAEESNLTDIIRMFEHETELRKEEERQRIKKIAADSIVTTEEITPPDIKINSVRRQLRL